jgi:hypothetical protein
MCELFPQCSLAAVPRSSPKEWHEEINSAWRWEHLDARRKLPAECSRNVQLAATYNAYIYTVKMGAQLHS